MLKLNSALELETEEGFVLGTVSVDVVTEHEFTIGSLLRFTIDDIVYNDTDPPGVVRAVFLKKCNSNRDKADSWTRIVFKSMAKSDYPLTIEQLVTEGR